MFGINTFQNVFDYTVLSFFFFNKVSRWTLCTYITEDLLSFGHPAQLRAVAVRVEHSLVFIPVLGVEFLQQQQNNRNVLFKYDAVSANKYMCVYR